MQNLQKTVLAHKFLDNNQYYGVSGLKLLSSGTEPVNLFGAQSLLEGEQFSFWGGISSDLGGGHGPGMPPMAANLSQCNDCARGVCPQHSKIVKTCKCEFCE